jgi:hypothetical protein
MSLRLTLATASLIALPFAPPFALAAEDRFVAPLPPPSEVEVKPNLAYRKTGEGSLAFDLYLAARRTAPPPVVIFVNGIGADWMRGNVQYTSWGRAVTARGLAGVTMDSREGSVDDDVKALVAHLGANAGALGIDASRVALWSCSANVGRGLALAETLGPPVRSAVVYYGGAEVSSFRRDLPVLFVRAGLDSPRLNRGLEALVARALADNAPVEVLNVAAGVHGFEIRDDVETSRAAIGRTLDFLTATLGDGLAQSLAAGQPLAAAAAAVYREDWPAAVIAYEGLVQTHPGDSLLWQRLGEARRARGDAPAALSAFAKALALGSPNHGIVSFAVATLKAQAGDVEGALASLQGMKRQLRFFAEQVRTDPVFEALRKDPRLTALLKDVPPPPR